MCTMDWHNSIALALVYANTHNWRKTPLRKAGSKNVCYLPREYASLAVGR